MRTSVVGTLCKNATSFLMLSAIFLCFVATTQAKATETVYTFTTTDSDPEGLNFWGPLTVSGTMTVNSAGPTSYNLTVVDLYTYTISSAAGFTQASQFPPTPCIIAGCGDTPPIPSGNISFGLYLQDYDNFSASLYDDGRDYSAEGTYTATTVPSSAPEPSTWAMLLIGFAGVGFAGYRAAKRNPQVRAA
jgi:hypothetical protein